jgi:osmotically-inducible protein OsmY
VSVQDEAITLMVQNAIAADRRISGQAIVVRVAKGEVFLKGIVDKDDQKEMAILVARGTPGVRHVVADELQVKEAPK